MTTPHLLDALDQLLARFVAFPSEHERHAVAAWVLHCWTLDAWDSTPRLALLSPEKGSGKTRTLEVLELVVPSPHHTVNMSASALFRVVGSDSTTATLLMDEADTYLGWKVASQHEDIRGLVNAGHRRGAVTYRVSIEKGVEVQAFPAYSAVALAGIGDLPDTIIDRSIVVPMKRRAPSEVVEAFRRRKVEPQTANLRDAIEMWAVDNVDALADLLDEVVLPDGIEDRAADVWEPLLTIGTFAGEPWLQRLTDAAIHVNNARQERDPSLGMQLVRDIRDIFTERDIDRITSVDLADALVDIEGAPWADIRGNPIDPNGIAKRLRPYGVRPDTHRFGDTTARGYLRADFYDVWNRYLPGETPPPKPRNTRNTHNTDAGTVTDVMAVMGLQKGYPPVCVSCDEPATAVEMDGTNKCADHVSWAEDRAS